MRNVHLMAYETEMFRWNEKTECASQIDVAWKLVLPTEFSNYWIRHTNTHTVRARYIVSALISKEIETSQPFDLLYNVHIVWYTTATTWTRDIVRILSI